MSRLLIVMGVILGSVFSLPSYAKFKVVTTFTVIQDIAQNVAGDAAVVESITELVCRNS